MSSQVLKSVVDEPKRRLTAGAFRGAAASAAQLGNTRGSGAVGPPQRGCSEPAGTVGKHEETHSWARNKEGDLGPEPPEKRGGRQGPRSQP